MTLCGLSRTESVDRSWRSSLASFYLFILENCDRSSVGTLHVILFTSHEIRTGPSFSSSKFSLVWGECELNVRPFYYGFSVHFSFLGSALQCRRTVMICCCSGSGSGSDFEKGFCSGSGFLSLKQRYFAESRPLSLIIDFLTFLLR